MTALPQVRYDIPVPVGNRAIKGKTEQFRQLLTGMKPGGSHDITEGKIGVVQRELLRVAKQISIPIKTRKLEGGRGLRVWRVQ